MFAEFLKELADSLVVEFFVVSRGYDGVIHIDAEPSLGNFVLKDVVHHRLKCSGGVRQAEEHYCWFEQSLTCFEGGLPLIALFDPDVVISPSYVEFGEESFIGKVMDQFWNEGERIFVGDRPLVEFSIVLYGSIFAVLLLNEEESAGVG